MVVRSIFTFSVAVFLFCFTGSMADAGIFDKLKEIGKTVEETTKKKFEEAIEKVNKTDDTDNKSPQSSQRKTNGTKPIVNNRDRLNILTYNASVPGIRPLQLASHNGLPVCGYPLLVGKYSKEEIQIRYNKQRKFEHEFFRYEDLLKLNSKPEIIQSEYEAWNYATKFLQDSLKSTYVKGKFNERDPNTPYSGWVGNDEFERADRAKEFINRFGPALVEMASRMPREVLEIFSFKVQQYDDSRNAFNIMPQIGGSIKSRGTYTYPDYWPVSKDRARDTLRQLNSDRVVYLGLRLSINTNNDLLYITT